MQNAKIIKTLFLFTFYTWKVIEVKIYLRTATTTKNVKIPYKLICLLNEEMISII